MAQHPQNKNTESTIPSSNGAEDIQPTVKEDPLNENILPNIDPLSIDPDINDPPINPPDGDPDSGILDPEVNIPDPDDPGKISNPDAGI